MKQSESIEQAIVDTFRGQSRELAVRPTNQPPRLQLLTDIRAVLFDVYGTLVISASGEVGTAARVGPSDAWEAALLAVGMEPGDASWGGAALLEAVIRRHHARARQRGVDYPEVDIVEVWREALRERAERERAERERAERERALAPLKHVDPRLLAAEYEARTNPTWPMPGLLECLRELRTQGMLLGLVSNAQFFTPLLFPALVGQTLDELGVESDLRFYSFQHGQAKPGEFLYRAAADACRGRGLVERQVLYVGNDMLNDVLPACRVGFRTALFAGDARSLRLREDDPRVRQVEPDLVLPDLQSLLKCVGRS